MSKELIERLRADAESTDDIGLCADAADRIEELERERDNFYMDYRMKCDEETKDSALVIIERDQLRTQIGLLRGVLGNIHKKARTRDVHWVELTIDEVLASMEQL